MKVLSKVEYDAYIHTTPGTFYEIEKNINGLMLIRGDNGFGEWFVTDKEDLRTDLYLWDYFCNIQEVRKKKLNIINDQSE